jgi:RNA polymerase sigma factor (sigma-70 family)
VGGSGVRKKSRRSNDLERKAGAVASALSEPDYSTCVAPARAAVARVAARFRLSPADAEDLHGDLWVRLLAKRGDVLRKFRRTARIETYLSTIATNIVIDSQRKTKGKWRPTARARREGAAAIELERLISRDGLPPDQAVARLAAEWPDQQRASLACLAQSIVPRMRRHEIGSDALIDCASPEPSPYTVVAEIETTQSAASLRRVLSAALAAFCQTDRDLMVWRYVDRRTVADVAATLRIDQKVLYRRFDRLGKRLRTHLEAGGFGWCAVSELLATSCDLGSGHARRPERQMTAAPCELKRPPYFSVPDNQGLSQNAAM